MNKKIYEKWYFWAIIIVIWIPLFLFFTQTKTYTLTGEQLGEYGREVILNKDTDMPVTKYLYKLPSGTYKVTTNNEKVSSFYIVKDELGTEESEYPEILQYVSDAYMLTTGFNDLNGRAQKEVEITLNEDESIQIIGTDTIILEKK